MIRFVFFLLVILFTFNGFGEATGKDIERTRSREIKKLKARKKGFDAYLLRQRLRDEARLAVASGQKKIRQTYAEKREKARRNFKRKGRVLPVEAYRTFVAQRKKRRKRLEGERQKYSHFRKQLKKIYQNKLYRIDGKKEFKL